MDFEEKPEEIPDILREEVQAELAKPGWEPLHDELEGALAIADETAVAEPDIALVGGVAIQTTALLDYIDDLREGREEEEEEQDPLDNKQEGVVADFIPDSAKAIGIEVREPPDDSDFFLDASPKPKFDDDDGEGGGGGGGGGGDGGDDDSSGNPEKPPDKNDKSDDKAKAKAAADNAKAKAAPKAPAKPPTKSEPPKGGGGAGPK